MNRKKAKKDFTNAGILLVLFGLLIAGLKTVDVQAAGPEGSMIGFASVNKAVQSLFGTHMLWYNITEVLGTLALLCAAGFGCLGLYQLIQRKSLKKVDPDLYVLGGFYVLVMALYALFEVVIINYRPLIMEGELEASFPSTHTMLTIFIMASAVMQFKKRLPRGNVMIAVNTACILILVLTVAGRLISGVHWFTDILGGLLLGTACTLLYRAVIETVSSKRK